MFIQVGDRCVNSDKIIYIEDVEHNMATSEHPALFFYWLKLDRDIIVQSHTFHTEQEAKLHRAQLINKLENK